MFVKLILLVANFAIYNTHAINHNQLTINSRYLQEADVTITDTLIEDTNIPVEDVTTVPDVPIIDDSAPAVAEDANEEVETEAPVENTDAPAVAEDANTVAPTTDENVSNNDNTRVETEMPVESTAPTEAPVTTPAVTPAVTETPTTTPDTSIETLATPEVATTTPVVDEVSAFAGSGSSNTFNNRPTIIPTGSNSFFDSRSGSGSRSKNTTSSSSGSGSSIIPSIISDSNKLYSSSILLVSAFVIFVGLN